MGFWGFGAMLALLISLGLLIGKLKSLLIRFVDRARLSIQRAILFSQRMKIKIVRKGEQMRTSLQTLKRKRGGSSDVDFS